MLKLRLQKYFHADGAYIRISLQNAGSSDYLNHSGSNDRINLLTWAQRNTNSVLQKAVSDKYTKNRRKSLAVLGIWNADSKPSHAWPSGRARRYLGIEAKFCVMETRVPALTGSLAPSSMCHRGYIWRENVSTFYWSIKKVVTTGLWKVGEGRPSGHPQPPLRVLRLSEGSRQCHGKTRTRTAPWSWGGYRGHREGDKHCPGAGGLQHCPLVTENTGKGTREWGMLCGRIDLCPRWENWIQDSDRIPGS